VIVSSDKKPIPPKTTPNQNIPGWFRLTKNAKMQPVRFKTFLRSSIQMSFSAPYHQPNGETIMKEYKHIQEYIQNKAGDLSGNVEHPFLQDLVSFHQEKKHYDIDQLNKPIYDTKDIDQMVWDNVSQGKIFKCADSLKGQVSTIIAANDTQEVIGARLQYDLNWKQRVEKHIIHAAGFTFCSFLGIEHDDILMKGELTAPIVEEIEEKGEEEETSWHCKGCSKYFATKASLKRHHDRKKSCKEFVEKAAATNAVKTEAAAPSEPAVIPDKPYIVEWADQILHKAISGDSEKPYCKHCDVEFANKSNLNKHLSKSIACDRLAKQEFVSFFVAK
jgi:hypothetical protein